MKLIQKFKEFVKNITPEDRLTILHHTDCDGICSGVLAAIAMERLRNKPIDDILHQPHQIVYMHKKLISELKWRNTNKLISVDLPLDEKASTVERASKFCDILILDHHPLYEKLDFENVILIKPQMITIKKYYPASKLVYDLFSEVVDISDKDWEKFMEDLDDDSDLEKRQAFLDGKFE